MNKTQTPEKQLAFLAVLKETGMVGKACEAIGVSRQTPHNWADKYPEFRRAWTKAERIATGVLKDEQTRLALEPHREETYNAKGELVKVVLKPNNKMLLAALQAREREEIRAEDKARREEFKISLRGLKVDQIAHRIADVLEAVERKNDKRLNNAVFELV